MKKNIFKLIGLSSLLMAGVAAGATKTIAYFEPKSN